MARLRLRSAESGPALALVHIEVESRDAAATIRHRMFEYTDTASLSPQMGDSWAHPPDGSSALA